MKVLHLGDIHLDASPNGRLDDTVEALARAATCARDADVAAVLIGGDLVERLGRPMLPAERNPLRAACAEFSRQAPVFIVAGNHDLPGDVLHVADVDTGENVVVIAERPGTWVTSAYDREPAWADAADGNAWDAALRACADRAPSLIVHALPWPRRSWLLAGTAAPRTLTDLAAATTEALRGVLAGLRARTEQVHAKCPGVPVVLLTHVNIRGARVASGQCMIGTDVEVGWEDLADVGADYVAAGHIHKRQSFGALVATLNPGWDINTNPGHSLHVRQHVGPRVWYSGSPCPRNFGEPERDHGGNLVTVRPGADPIVEAVTLAPVALVTVEATYDRATDTFLPVTDWNAVEAPCDVRFRYDVTHDDAPAAMRAEAHARAGIMEMRARSVVFDPRVAPKEARRSGEVAAARTVRDKLDAYFDTQKLEQDPPRRERVFTKLAVLQGDREDGVVAA